MTRKAKNVGGFKIDPNFQDPLGIEGIRFRRKLAHVMKGKRKPAWLRSDLHDVLSAMAKKQKKTLGFMLDEAVILCIKVYERRSTK